MLAGLFRKTKMQPWEIPALPGESPAAHKERKRQTYSDDQRENNQEWFKRMNFQIDVTGMRVLDLGCGHGALSVSFAELGAAEVVGIDLDDDRIDFANRNLTKNFPELAPTVIGQREAPAEQILRPRMFKDLSRRSGGSRAAPGTPHSDASRAARSPRGRDPRKRLQG